MLGRPRRYLEGGSMKIKGLKMNLEQIQIALFSAYDVRNAMSQKQRKQNTQNETFGDSIDQIIEILEQLEMQEVQA